MLPVRSRCLVFLVCLLSLQVVPAAGQSPVVYDSKNFRLKTDLPKEKAEALNEKLETMLRLISRYWGVPNRRQIECCVIKDLRNWPPGSIDSRAIAAIRGGGGITTADRARRGNQIRMRTIAWAVARTETVQHEAVHAYCYNAFGHCGPIWYAEGMAEMGSYWIEGNNTVTAPAYITQYLRKSKRLTIKQIVSAKKSKSDSWRTYAWRWALCHLLASNSNYSERFRPLGLNLLTRRRGSFSATYGSRTKELGFEYSFFLDHARPGYDVDRCRWDWDARFRKLKPGRSVSAKIKANRGWQASGLQIEKGLSYAYQADGKWQTSPDGPEVTAEGGRSSDVSVRPLNGRLRGVVMSRYNLGKPVSFGVKGHFTADEDGELYLRCADEWHRLADNSGELSVRWTLQEMPQETPEKQPPKPN